METSTSGQSKQSRIETLLKAAPEKPDFQAIAKEVGTSVQYVYDIGYDLRSNGGLTRAKKKHAAAHPGRIAASKRKWHRKNPGHHRRWRKNNPEKVRQIYQRMHDTTFAHQHYQRYTDEELRMILDTTIPDSKRAKQLGRNTQALANKRYYLKKKLNGVRA